MSVTGAQFTTTSTSADGTMLVDMALFDSIIASLFVGRTQQATITQNDIVAINDPSLGQSIDQYVQATKMLAMSGALASNPTFTVMNGGDAKITKEGHHILRINAHNVKGNQIMGSYNKNTEIEY